MMMERMTKKELKERGWGSRDVQKYASYTETMSIEDLEEKFFDTERLKENRKRRFEQIQESENKKLANARKHDKNLIINGGLWIDTSITENEVDIRMKLYNGNASRLSVARHDFTHYDDIVRKLKLKESEYSYKNLINDKLIKEYPFLKGEV